MSADPYRDWDAAYVLGSLPPPDRRIYEGHLTGCADCRQAVSELAAMPGLLARVPAAEAMAGEDPMPESLSMMRPPRRIRGVIIFVLVIMLSLAIGGVVGYLIHDAMPGQPPRSPDSALRVAFAPVDSSRMIAVAEVTPDSGGTRIDVDCQYSSRSSSTTSHRYLLYVVDKSGDRVESRSWWAAPGTPSSPQLRSRLPMEDIEALEIVLADSDRLLMRAAVS